MPLVLTVGIVAAVVWLLVVGFALALARTAKSADRAGRRMEIPKRHAASEAHPVVRSHGRGPPSGRSRNPDYSPLLGRSHDAPVIGIADDGAVRLVTLDRPDALDAFDAPLYRGLASALDDARADDSVHVVVLTGVGRSFSAGQDLAEMARLAAGEPADAGFPVLLEAVQAFDKPLLAAVNGFAIGIGFTLLPHCDLVLVAESARFRTPFAHMGVPPEAASSYTFPARMGWQRATYVLFTDAWLSADDAVEYGIAFAAHPEAELLPRTMELAASIAAAPLPALRAIKRAMMAAQAPAIAAAAGPRGGCVRRAPRQRRHPRRARRVQRLVVREIRSAQTLQE